MTKVHCFQVFLFLEELSGVLAFGGFLDLCFPGGEREI